jgi:hypothetical protein
MDKKLWDQLAAAGGIVGVALFIVAFIVFGTPPDVDASGEEIASFFADNRGSVLTAIFLQGLGVLALIWFFAALSTAMREVGEQRLATAGIVSFVVAFAVGSLAAMTYATLAYTVAEDGGAETVRALYSLGKVADLFSGLLFVGATAAVAGATARAKLFPAWGAWLSGAVGLLIAVSATGWAHDGFWSPDGIGVIGFFAFMVWAVVFSALLTLRARQAASPVAAVPAS